MNNLFPLDFLHQYAFCPRRAFLMYVDGHWNDNKYTIEGKQIHRSVDEEDEPIPDCNESDDEPIVVCSVPLESEKLGITCKIDLVEVNGMNAVPVEYKRGSVPDVPEKSYESERVQLMGQALLLREAGYTVDHGILYFRKSRCRVSIQLTQDLENRALSLLEEAKKVAQNLEMPHPLDSSPKCSGCSLSAICLPDETNELIDIRQNRENQQNEYSIRRLFPARDDAVPIYIQEQGAYVGKKGENLHITKAGKEILSAHLIDISQVVLCGNISISPMALHMCISAQVPVVHLSMGFWFYGITQGFGLRNAYDRAAQFSVAADSVKSFRLAQAFVSAKTNNQRTLLRRNGDVSDNNLTQMSQLIDTIKSATTFEELLGLEGSIARIYFSNFTSMLKPKHAELWDFSDFHRNRRPPKDPVNALLSFGYAILAKDAAVALQIVGLDPHWGFFHKPRHGRPALALDLMEEFRSLLVDSAVITCINTEMITINDFERTTAACMLSPAGRKSFLKAYENRMDQLITHPIFNYRCSWRRIIAMQAQLLARCLRGEIPTYDGMVTR